MKRMLLLLSSLFALGAAAAPGITVQPEYSREAVGMKTYAAPPRLAQRSAIAPASTLASAVSTVPEELAAIRLWNDADRSPMRNGFTRTVGDPISVRLEGPAAMKSGATTSSLARGLVAATDHGTLVWSGSVRVEDAYRLRLHLSNVQLPENATLWVYSDNDAPRGFGKELLWEGSLYTPSVSGPTIYLDVEVPAPKSAADVASFEIRDLLEIVQTGGAHSFQPNDSPSCLVDATCVGSTTYDAIADARAAIAQLQYVKNGSGFVCSGGLINDKVPAPSFIPYLLTANHCFDSQASASSLEAYFDYKTSSCGGSFPPFGTAVNGSTLLATGTTSDFTFVRLNSIPANRTFLGWTTSAQSEGTKIHRVSHPFPDSFSVPAPQAYSSSNINSFFGTCSGRPLSNYIYSTGGSGGTYGGSSGSPVLLSGGVVVGQLFGACGSDPSAGCDRTNNANVDGKFASTFPSIEQYINVTGSAGCVATSTAMCLNNDRFKVEATYQTGSGQSGQAQVVRLTSDTGYLWFFSSTNVEVVVKVLNACGINGYWVFAGGLTDVRVTLTVTDTKSGAIKTYTNPLGTPFAPIQDTSAFSTCP